MEAIRTSEDFLSARGINLAVPINKDPSRALVMLNWRPDRMVGRLRSRLGHGTAIATYAASIHTIWLNQGSTRYIGAGTVLYRGTTSILTGLDGRKLFFASVQKFLWIMNRNAQKKDDGTTVTDWWVAPPGSAATVTPTGVGVLNGTSPIVYYVTFENADGHESGVGTNSTPTIFTNQQASLTAIPLGPSGTSKRHIYRIGAGLTQLLRVGTIANNTTTTYTDNEQNELTELRLLVGRTNRQAPPAARGCTYFLGRLVAWCSAEFPNRIFCTEAQEFWYFPEENAQDVGDWKEDILACAEINGSLYVVKERSVWRISGDPTISYAERVTSEVGLPSELAIALGRLVIPYLSRKGVFAFNGDRPKKLTELVDPLFNGEGVVTGSGDVLQAINLQELGEAVLEVSDGRVWASIPGGSSAVNSQTVIINLDSGELVHDNRGFTALSQEGVSGPFVGAIGSKLFNLENGQTDEGVPISVNYQTNFNEFGAPDNDKQVFELRIRHSLGAQTISIKLLFDKDLVTTPLGITSSLTGNGETRFPVNVSIPEAGRLVNSMSVMIEGSLTAEIEITELACTYMVHPRLTKIWFSAVMNQLQYDMYEARQVQAEFDAGTSDVTLKLMADGQTGGDIAVVETLTLPVTGSPGRRTTNKMLSQLQPGRLWQLALSSTSEVRGYECAIEMRRVPVFLDGSKGQFYERDSVSLGA